MSDPADSTGTPGTKSNSLGPLGAWVDKMLPLLDGTRQTDAAHSGETVQAAPVSQPYLIGGNQDDVKRAFDKIEKQRLANEAKKQAEDQKKQAEADSQWSFEDALKNKIKDLPPVFQFPAKKPPVLGPDEFLRTGDNDYEKLPKDLKSKMLPEVWEAIKGQRAKLFTIYMRLKEYGAWDVVSKVVGIKEKLPPHGKLGALEFGIYGTGGIAFEETKAGAVAAILVGTRHFGQDNKIMALWHQGQKSYREWRNDQITAGGVLDESIHEWGKKSPPPPSSLHLSMGPGTSFDAHIDRISPVAKPVDGQSVPGTDASEHLSNEAIGPTAYGVTPSVEVKKDKDGWHGMSGTFWINYKLEWDITSGNAGENKNNKKKTKRQPPPVEPVPEDLRKSICARARKLSQRFPRTSEGDIDSGLLAEYMAGSVLAAAKNGKTTIGVPFPNYSDTVLSEAEQKVVHDAVLEIGKIVTSELGPKAGKVKNVTVYLPAQGAFDVRVKK